MMMCTDYRVLKCFFLLWIGVLLAGGTCFSQQPPEEKKVPPGPLSKVHSHLSGSDQCIRCHSKENTIDAANCLQCHRELAKRMKAGSGFHRDKTEDCEVCHAEHQGQEQGLIDLDTGDFDHAETGYLLEGAHGSIRDCGLCHRKDRGVPGKKGRSYLLKDNRCVSCHSSPHSHSQPVCMDCHVSGSWRVDAW